MTRTTIKIALVVLVVAASGFAGFRVGLEEGFRKGGTIMSTLAAQNEVSDALSGINNSLLALDKHDLEYSTQRHQRDLQEALIKLGSYGPLVPYMKCKERDKSSIKDGVAYLKNHPDNATPVVSPFFDRALKFCQQ